MSRREPEEEVWRREAADPEEQQNPVPWPVAAIALGLIAWGFAYFFQNTGYLINAGDRRMPIEAAAPAAADGAAVYSSRCASCHQATGQGVSGAFPPLAGSSWVVAAPDIPVQILLHGLNGTVEVAGESYDGVMPAFGPQLSDAEIAAVLTHIRSQWGNDAPPIEDDFVADQRQRFPERGPWQGGAELRRVLGSP